MLKARGHYHPKAKRYPVVCQNKLLVKRSRDPEPCLPKVPLISFTSHTRPGALEGVRMRVPGRSASEKPIIEH
jgi:hypothetical protein